MVKIRLSPRKKGNIKMNNAPKKKNQSRQDLYVTLIVVLMMVAVIVAISVSLAKSTKKIEEASKDSEIVESVLQTIPEDEDDDVPTIETEDVVLKEDETKAPETEEKDTEKTDAPITDEVQVIPDFILPVQGELLKGCSLEVPVFSLTMEDYRTHTGIDLYCDIGSDVAAAARGTVKEIWDDPMMGTCISIEHTGGSVTVYKNLCDDIPSGIEVGRTVEAGQIIATAGDTALLELCEDSHIHFELYIGDKAVDPMEYVEMKNEIMKSE